MDSLCAFLVATFVGAIAAFPIYRQLRGERHDIARGFSAVILAFLEIQLGMFAVDRFFHGHLILFGITATLVFLLIVVTGGVLSQLKDDRG